MVEGHHVPIPSPRLNPMAIERTREVLSSLKNLTPWPPVAMRILEISRQEDVMSSDLVNVLRTDVAFTARILKLTNSAFYGFQREIDSLHAAGNRLGTKALVSLVLTSCVGQSFSGAKRTDDVRARRLWEHSVMNGLAAGCLAGINGDVDRNTAYTAGLLQDMGYIVISGHLQETRDEIRAERNAGATELEAERIVHGLDHAQIGARLLRHWKFPEKLVDAVHHHHDPENAQVDSVLTSLVNLGAGVTKAVALGEGLHNMAYGLSDGTLGLAGLTHGQLERMEALLMLELARARDLVQQAA
jgi:putative nucleotidyltransferase with HDIG domain